MPTTRMSESDRNAYLEVPRLGVLSVNRITKGPVTVPTWFEHIDGTLRFTLGESSYRAKVLRAANRATLLVHNDTRPYSYLMAEGPVEIRNRSIDDAHRMAARYIGTEAADQYVLGIKKDGLIATLTPEQWFSVVYT